MQDCPDRAAPTAAAIAGTAIVLIALGSLWVRGRSLDVQYSLFVFHNGPPALLLFWLGRLVWLRQPQNRIGSLLQTIAGLGAAHVAVAAVADAALVSWGYTAPLTLDHPLIPAEVPLSASVPFWIMNWLWVPQVVLIVTILPLLFPDGHLPGSRWRVGLWLSTAATLALLFATAVDAWPTGTRGTADPPAASVMVGFIVGGLLILGAVAVSLASLITRWRRAPEADRQPFRLVGSTAGILAVVLVATYPWQPVWVPASLASIYVLLTAYALAAARFRVHDLEPVLTKGAVANALAIGAIGLLAAAVLAVGLVTARLMDSRVLPFVVVALVAVAAEPSVRRARQLVDRLVFRLSADRASVFSSIADQVSREHPTAELLDGVVDALRRGSGATRVEAWLAHDGLDTMIAGSGGASRQNAVLTASIISQGERLGEFRVFADVPGDLVPDAQNLVADVAHVTGAALHNGRLAGALADRIGALESSQRRLVEAQDTARRGIERDLHDGAQAQLIALRMRLALLKARVGEHQTPALTAELEAIGADVDAAVDTLRDLARGLSPPILEQGGVAAALRAQARAFPIPVELSADTFGRLDAAVESALYFAALEAMQNALRHSSATVITVRLFVEGEEASFTVTDDGAGFVPPEGDQVAPGTGLRNAEDRLGALGGRLVVDSTPGGGTRVTGSALIGPGRIA